MAIIRRTKGDDEDDPRDGDLEGKESDQEKPLRVREGENIPAILVTEKRKAHECRESSDTRELEEEAGEEESSRD
ncbi:hypothetical protein CDL15_Pgr026771 [Punica granatum]|uniref:Uncharacterized protein n=1 Tax=Punica granatum TaxID=22663 RepID=A0A218WN63_PUNGR|nr:hypothetical protein CDL15_Pgr026771 [Punica granatum]